MTNTTQSTAVAVKGMDIIAFLTGDPQRSIAFYRDVLGIVPTDVDDQGRGAEFTLADGSTFGVWQPDEGPKQGASIMFAVDDINAAVSLFRSRGAQLTEPQETPVCFMSFGSDPDGNGFMIHQRKPANV